MSAFSELLTDADALGVTKLSFECALDGYAVRPDREGRWTCRATTPKMPVGVVETEGRTGEEALRRLVEFMKAVQ